MSDIKKEFQLHYHIDIDAPQNYILLFKGKVTLYGLYIEQKTLNEAIAIGLFIKSLDSDIDEIGHVPEWEETTLLFNEVRKQYKDNEMINGHWLINFIQQLKEEDDYTQPPPSLPC